MKVLSFVNTLPRRLISRGAESNHKYQTLKLFAQGAAAAGDEARLVTHNKLEACDVAMMLGWVHEHSKQAPHLALRQAIINQQRSQNQHVVVADSNLFLYADQENQHQIQRYSFDGVFPNTGIYCDTDVTPHRWEMLQRMMNISVKPWQHNGQHILICLQRDGGWSMLGLSVASWACQIIRNLRKTGCGRDIVLRGHPGDKNFSNTQREIQDMLVKTNCHGRVSFSPPGRTLIQDLSHAHAMINHNSSPAVAAAIEGVPIFVTDPMRSQAQEVANHDLTQIDSPRTFDRDAWLWRLAQCHWSHGELASGACWRHMRQFI